MDDTYQRIFFMLYKFLLGIIQRVFGGTVRLAADTPPLSWLVEYVRMVVPYVRAALNHIRTLLGQVLSGFGHIMAPAIPSGITTLLLVYLRGFAANLMNRAMSLVRRLFGLVLYITYAFARSAYQQTLRMAPIPQLRTATDSTQVWLNAILDMIMRLFLDALRRYFEPTKPAQVARLKK